MASQAQLNNESTDGFYPVETGVSPLQEAMVVHAFRSPAPGANVIQIVGELHEPVDVAVFTKAWNAVTARHDVLRASFHFDPTGGIRQRVHPNVRLRVTSLEWENLQNREAKWRELLQNERLAGFELTVAPLMRVHLARFAPEHFRFLWTIHHLIIDARSFGLVLSEVFSLYGQMLRGAQTNLPHPVSFLDQVGWAEKQDWEKTKDFWISSLGNRAEVESMLRSESTPTKSVFEELTTSLDSATATGLRKLAADNEVTVNTVIQGAWGLLISRYTGSQDIVFAAVRACRRSSIPNGEAVVGPMINTVPLAISCPGEAPLGDWLRTIRQQWFAMRPAEHTPLAKIQGWIEAAGGRLAPETLLSVQAPSWQEVLRQSGGEWEKRIFTIHNQPNFPLSLDVAVGNEVGLTLVFDSARLEQESARRLLENFTTVLRSLISGAQVLRDVCVVAAEEWKLIKQWNSTEQPLSDAATVVQTIDRVTQQNPNALAVQCGAERLTYAELTARANALAVKLIEQGVGPERVVGVFLDRSIENVISLLAILKAGGAYLPIDPEYPMERIGFILSDAGAGILLTRKKFVAQLKGSRANVILVEDVLSEAGPTEVPSPKVTSSDLAYVIYTSGSTGQPKGVEIEHAGLLNLVQWHQRTYKITEKDRATLLANPAFDASVWELWPYLMAGASVHIPPTEDTRLNGEKLIQWLTEQGITVSFMPTPLAEAALDHAWPANSSLRVLLTGGDRLRKRPSRKLPFVLVNHYGPTENSVVTTCGAVPAEGTGAPTIGRPIDNTEIYILDRDLQPTPIGGRGELYIAGIGLARGYRGQPSLTEERFIRNPFKDSKHTRLYQTGDYARLLRSGEIEYLGRTDQQVKIRGRRIELGEIEAALSTHPAVKEAVVACHSEKLIGYVAAVAGVSCDPASLREHLGGHLPSYMIPRSYVFLPEMPLTANGKIDRRRLPEPQFETTEWVAPITNTEQKLAAIWQELLKVERAGREDNFFELGGHSLLLTKLIARVSATFQVQLSMEQIFGAETLRDLAAVIDEMQGQQAGKGEWQIQSRQPGEEMPLSFAQERLWFLEQLEPGLAVNNIPLGIRLEGELNRAALRQALEQIVERHSIFRAVFQNRQGQPFMQIKPGMGIDLPIVDLSSSPEPEAEFQKAATAEAQLVFNLEAGPLIRFKLVRLRPASHILLLTTHHIVADGWTAGIIFRELAELYQAYSESRLAVLPELKIAYPDYTEWQRSASDRFEPQLKFWKSKLSGSLPAMELPADKPRPATQRYHGGITRFALRNNLVSALKQLARAEDATLFMSLLAAFKVLLHRYSGQDDIIVGTTTAGRVRPELENLAGLFLNNLALRSSVDGQMSFRAFLRAVRQTAQEAYAHQDVPFEKVVEAVQPQRDLSRSPVFQVMLVLQNAPLTSQTIGGVQVTPVPLHTGTAKYDLTLSLEETEGGITGSLEYNSDLFEAGTALRILTHYQTLLESIVASPDERIGKLEILTEAERKQLLVEWNQTQTDIPEPRCVHELFEATVQRTPNDVAVTFEAQSLTYAELNARANRVARHLQTAGVGPESLVGICLPRSAEMIVGLLGILKAGAAYVPLDPTYPEERLRYMIEDAQAAVLVTNSALATQFPNIASPIVDIHRIDCEPVQPADKTNTLSGATGDNLAYVIYTSGSTGKPKGVMINHRNVANFFVGMDQLLGQKRGVWLAVTSICFDISVLELFWTLARGFHVVIQSENGGFKQTGEQAGDFSIPSQIARHGVTHFQCTPSLAGMLLQDPEGRAALRSVGAILLGGEALPPSLVEELQPAGQLINMYGPTETTVWSASYCVCGPENPMPIGRPIANTQIYILDANRQLAPIGVPGELYIGGAGVVRGYLRRPELTSERFVHDCFAEVPARMYRTGDRARFRADGNIEFLGRMDFQVKLRGFRIELGEIEALLRQQPGIRDAVVVVREPAPGDKRLVAYLISEGDEKALPDLLRTALKAKLPEYMTPSAFVFLKEFPLTPNGKLDRKALPEPEGLRASAKDYVAARNDTETTIAGIWQELLHMESIGVNDNFFDLGGHSLLAVKAHARICGALGVEMPVIKMFQLPTIAALAGELSRGKPEGQGRLQKIRARAQRQREAIQRTAAEPLATP